MLRFVSSFVLVLLTTSLSRKGSDGLSGRCIDVSASESATDFDGDIRTMAEYGGGDTRAVAGEKNGYGGVRAAAEKCDNRQGRGEARGGSICGA